MPQFLEAILGANDFLVPFFLGALVGWIAEFLLDWNWWGRRQKRFGDRIALLEGDLEKERSIRAGMQQSVDNADQRARQLEDDLEDARHSIGTRDAELDEMRGQVESSDIHMRQSSATEQANDTLRERLDSAETRIRTLEQEKEQLQAHLDRQQSDADVSVANYNALQATLADRENQIGLLTNERDTMRNQLADNEEKMAGFTTMGSGDYTDSGEVVELRTQLNDAESEIARLRDQLTNAPQQTTDIDLKSRLDAAENDLLNEHNKVVAAEVKLQNMADKLTDERMRSEGLNRRVVDLEAQLGSRSKPSTGTVATAGAAALGGTAAGRVVRNEPKPKPKPEPKAKSTPKPKTSAKPDDLTKINGIGKVFAKRLNQAGVMSFHQLAALDGEEIKKLVQAQEWQAVDADAWIAEASKFAGEA